MNIVEQGVILWRLRTNTLTNSERFAQYMDGIQVKDVELLMTDLPNELWHELPIEVKKRIHAARRLALGIKYKGGPHERSISR